MGGGSIIYHGGVPWCTVNTEDLNFKWFSFIFLTVVNVGITHRRNLSFVSFPFVRVFHLYKALFMMISPYLQQALASLLHSAQSKQECPHMDNKPSDVSSGRCCISNLRFCYRAANVSFQRLHGHVISVDLLILSLYSTDLHSFMCLIWEGTFKGKERNLSTFNRQ